MQETSFAVESVRARRLSTLDGARRERWHTALRWLLVVPCLFFARHGIHAGLRPEGSDFTIYYQAGRAVLAGQDPTLVPRFLYLPAFAVAVAPLALLPYAAALVLWQAASLAALLWIVARCRRMCERELGRELPWLEWAPLLCTLRLVDSSFANGQANLLVLGIVVGAIDAWLLGRDRRAGVLVGCATALKIEPGFLVLVFAWRRAGRAFLAAVVSALLLVVPLSALALGWHDDSAGLVRWFQVQVVPYLRGGRELLAAHEVLPGQSLTAAAYRLLCDAPASSNEAGSRANLVALGPEQVKSIVRALQLGLLALLAATLTRSVRRSDRGARLREAALVACAALALAPLVHKAHMAWLLLPYAVLLSGTPAGLTSLERGLRWTLIALSVFAIGATAPAVLGRSLATWTLTHDSVFVGLLCVMGVLVLDTWCARGVPRESRRAALAERS